jgi:hypothetical protein
MTIMNCDDTESGAREHRASAAFEEASSQLEELGFELLSSNIDFGLVSSNSIETCLRLAGFQ